MSFQKCGRLFERLKALGGLWAPLGLGVTRGDVAIIDKGAFEIIFLLIVKSDALIFFRILFVNFLTEPRRLVGNVGIGVVFEEFVDFLSGSIDDPLIRRGGH